ncbi:type II toxin-antitoxin system RelE/ParE family toxin [Flavisolibacter ginsenosidimutans]|uniref:Addiction module toxin RelE n=1 Tax=Flavisolibacter ginsenosidimutans TaxID=661481 RepID=A0A5B8UQK9_9BACT|nr:type II toxin-antitoxin system RelE/ParE family toxin [Flavisolibacter ginsenosidimutans]QEC58270.1 hypothetical protein FSB75_20955 [Flavisolibacter ginsenosidimutans]
MSYEVRTIQPFEREAEKLARKYPSLKNDLAQLVESLESNPKQGTPLGENFYKIRLAIKSKGKGKSGGARVITFVLVVQKKLFLSSIYDKSDKENITDKELKHLVKIISSQL